MAALFILLKAAPEEEQHVRFARNLARAAAAQGHSVTLFALGEGVYNLATGLGGQHGDYGIALDGQGAVRVLYCHYNAEQRAVAERIRQGFESSATSQAGILVARSDRFVTISA